MAATQKAEGVASFGARVDEGYVPVDQTQHRDVIVADLGKYAADLRETASQVGPLEVLGSVFRECAEKAEAALSAFNVEVCEAIYTLRPEDVA